MAQCNTEKVITVKLTLSQDEATVLKRLLGHHVRGAGKSRLVLAHLYDVLPKLDGQHKALSSTSNGVFLQESDT